MAFLASFEWFWVEVLMNGVYFSIIVIYLELLVAERVDSSTDDAHLVLIEAKVLNAVCVLHYFLHLER